MQYGAVIMTIAFDTLKLADRLEAAGMPSQQAKGVATALAETATANLVTREFLDLRLGEIRATIAHLATKAELAEAKSDILRWIVGAIGFQTIVIVGAVAALFRLLH